MLLQLRMEFRYPLLLLPLTILMDTGLKGYRQIYCRRREIILVPTHTNELTGKEVNFSIQTGPDGVVILHPAPILFKNITS